MVRRRRQAAGGGPEKAFFILAAFGALVLAILFGLHEAFGEWAMGLLTPQ